MTKKYKNHAPEFKFKVALAAISQEKTLKEIASEFDIGISLVAHWKNQLLEGRLDFFQDKPQLKATDEDKNKLLLEREVEKLKLHVDWLKKKLQ